MYYIYYIIYILYIIHSNTEPDGAGLHDFGHCHSNWNSLTFKPGSLTIIQSGSLTFQPRVSPSSQEVSPLPAQSHLHNR